MPRRIEIELTSLRPDGSWTWRAAGARQPRGVLEGSSLPDSARVGDVLRVEAESELDGVTILNILTPREKAAPKNRIEIIGPPRPAPGVTTSLIEKRESSGPRRGGDRPRRPPGDRDQPERRGDRPPPSRGGPPPAATEAGARRRPERSAQPARPAAGDRARPGARPSTRSPEGAPTDARPVPRRPARPVPGTTHRDAVFASLPAEHRPIAEQLAKGGLPGVRRALAEERDRAREEGRALVQGDAILAIAEQLRSAVAEAIWLDRAEMSVAHLEELSLGDLRAVVVGAAPRDEHGRELDRRLREHFEERIKRLRLAWETEITHALEEGRVLQALRLSARLPEPTARFPTTLVARLADAASAGMTAETSPERWLALLEGASESPVRRSVRPFGLPPDPSGAVERAALLAAGRIPALAPLLGMTMPPPPRPLPGACPGPVGRPARRGPRPPARSARAEHPVVGEPGEKPVDEVETGKPGDVDEGGLESVVPGTQPVGSAEHAGSEVEDHEVVVEPAPDSPAEQITDLDPKPGLLGDLAGDGGGEALAPLDAPSGDGPAPEAGGPAAPDEEKTATGDDDRPDA